MDCPSKIAVGKLMTIHKLGLINGYANTKCIKITAEELYNIYNSKKWIHDVDDIQQIYK